ncbi:HAMP domain-containing histidine kinase (plasmid) [Skermanella mucosa]|uniref:sensor histidine kinase n=1 Tax=Skermanella mucosa TaxID=1789672 RepID=UPI00192BC483|nr:HAMP domain-containing sensor histidine kinase [Skermanella mucosa]UEM24450.1 HAMP domain-containing histidine kinase [Skermanella mucosa]
MDLGKIVWTVSFVLVLCSMPMLIPDLIGIQRSVEVSSGAGERYDGELSADLLRFQVAVRALELNSRPEAVEEVMLRLDNVFNRLNAFPEPGSAGWHTWAAGREDGVAEVRRVLDRIDGDLPLLRSDPTAFRTLADRGAQEAVTVHRRMQLAMGDQQNVLVGRIQHQVSVFQMKLLGYGAGFVVVVGALAWLMRRHMRSEKKLLATNRQLRDLSESLVVARDMAVRSNEAKSNFLANVSHELRTPLNAILGFSEALMSGIFGRLAGRQAEYVGDIHLSGQRLLALINDILDLAKLDAGKLELREEAVALDRLAAEAIRGLREASSAAGVTVDLTSVAGGMMVLGDPLRLRQVLDNLLSNAVKFTPEGGRIEVAVERLADGHTVVIVTDTGIGIPARDLARVFLPFEQSDSRRARPAQGTGLGLPLVRQLVESHGGTVRMSSEPGIGTEVTVELPPERVLPAEGNPQPVVQGNSAAKGRPRSTA